MQYLNNVTNSTEYPQKSHGSFRKIIIFTVSIQPEDWKVRLHR
jgi:hypothetical protein